MSVSVVEDASDPTRSRLLLNETGQVTTGEGDASSASSIGGDVGTEAKDGIDRISQPSSDVATSKPPVLGSSSSKKEDVFIAAARPPLQSLPVLTKNAKANTKSVPTTTVSTTTSTKAPSMVDNLWGGLREILGIHQRGPCPNGGSRLPNGKCVCTSKFEGAICERRKCFNGGQLAKTTIGQVAYECKCPHPQYIEGPHCEQISCANSGRLINGTTESWSCDCSDSMFYKGRFCENFSTPYAVMAVPLLCLLIIFICCALCRIDWCARQPRRGRRAPEGNRSRSSGAQQQAQGAHNRRMRTSMGGRGVLEQRMGDVRREAQAQQERLLTRDRDARLGQLAAYPAAHNGPPYVIRLDTIPTFNPDMIGGVEPVEAAVKPMEPPPPYDQALLAPTSTEPPRYTEREQRLPQPPPPNRQPPPPPRQ